MRREGGLTCVFLSSVSKSAYLQTVGFKIKYITTAYGMLHNLFSEIIAPIVNLQT